MPHQTQILWEYSPIRLAEAESSFFLLDAQFLWSWNKWEPHYIYLQLIFIIHGVGICEFAYSLKCISNLKVNTCSAFAGHLWACAKQLKFESPDAQIPSWGLNEAIISLPSCFSSHTVKVSVLLVVHLVLCFPHFCAFYWWFYCLKWPTHVVLMSCNAVLCS